MEFTGHFGQLIMAFRMSGTVIEASQIMQQPVHTLVAIIQWARGPTQHLDPRRTLWVWWLNYSIISKS